MATPEHEDAATPAQALDEPLEAFSDSEASEYGLKDLAKLPLLEQVHRLFHAIQQKYPYTETRAWKALPLEQKRKMLAYIRDRRANKPPPSGVSTATSDAATIAAPSQPIATAATAVSTVIASSATTVKTDPYLQMLQKRSLQTSTMPGQASATLAHPSSAYVAGQVPQVARYVDAPPLSRRNFKARWKVVDAEFFEDAACACGETHDALAYSGSGSGASRSAGGAHALMVTMHAMVSTFGDTARPCSTAVNQVKAVVGDYLHERLASIAGSDREVNAPCLRTLVEIFAEEAVYYGRWREFRGETKQQEPDLEDVEEEALAEELDLFAVSEADAVFNESFLERIRFADERTRGMDWSIYDSFAKSRKLNFMSHKCVPFRQWLRLGACSRASLEFMNFVAYHNIGRLVEAAIKARTGGRLQILDTPLMKSDIDAATAAFISEPRYRPKTFEGEGKNADAVRRNLDQPPTKMLKVDASLSPIPVCAPPVDSSASSSAGATTPERVTPQRLTRLKRLR